MSFWRWLTALGAAALVLTWWSAAAPAEPPAPMPLPETAVSKRDPSNTSLPQFDAAADSVFARAPAKPEFIALWRGRLERAQATLTSYREATRYPFNARPLSEQPDQAFPYRPIVEERAFRLPQGTVIRGLNLKTTQDRVHIQAQESVTVTVAAVDDAGKPLPLSIQRAWAHEGGRGQQASHPHIALVEFRDDGSSSDQHAGDGVHTAVISPTLLGFSDLAGTLRVEVSMEAQHGSVAHPGYAYFDVVTHPENTAKWLPGAQDKMEHGSLLFDLPVEVYAAGRYVATGRVDDANGKPFALLTFNEELRAGKQRVRLVLFGKLVRDFRPRFPLKLRDVQAFRLVPDTFPDRVMLPKEGAPTVLSGQHAYLSFSDAEWQSEERGRYLAEYSKDVQEAEDQLRHAEGTSP